MEQTCRQAGRSTIHRWLNRFESEGEAGLWRKPVCGRPRIIETLDSQALSKIVLAPASKFGYETDFWTARRLRQVILDQHGVAVSKQTILRRLHEAGLSYQKPERQYFELSEEERTEWRRKERPAIRRAVRKYRAILYFQDEANISLTALLGKTPAGRQVGTAWSNSQAKSDRQTRWGIRDVGADEPRQTDFSSPRQANHLD